MLNRVEVCCIMTIGRYMQHTCIKLEPWTFCASPSPHAPGWTEYHPDSWPCCPPPYTSTLSTLSFTPSLTSLSSMICKYTYLTFLLWLSDTSQTRCLDIIALTRGNLPGTNRSTTTFRSVMPSLTLCLMACLSKKMLKVHFGEFIFQANVILSLTFFQIGANRKLGAKRREGNGWD